MVSQIFCIHPERRPVLICSIVFLLKAVHFENLAELIESPPIRTAPAFACLLVVLKIDLAVFFGTRLDALLVHIE